MFGLQRGTVRLYPHETAWEAEAEHTIIMLQKLLGDDAKEIQHVGSTAVPTICAKPIIDIALAVNSFDDVMKHLPKLQAAGFYYRAQNNISGQKLFACGSFYDGTGDLQTHFIYVVLTGSEQWRDYILFRDYLNQHADTAKAYESLKLSLAEAASVDAGREQYLQGKKDFIAAVLRKALAASFLGQIVEIKIDRPLGSAHPKHLDLIYPVNYGFIPGVFGGDGEEMDVYLLGVDGPAFKSSAQIIAVVHRSDDEEDKLVGAPVGTYFTKAEIEKSVAFQEQYFKTGVEMWKG